MLTDDFIRNKFKAMYFYAVCTFVYCTDEKGAIIEESENLKGKKSKESQDDLEMVGK